MYLSRLDCTIKAVHSKNVHEIASKLKANNVIPPMQENMNQ